MIVEAGEPMLVGESKFSLMLRWRVMAMEFRVDSIVEEECSSRVEASFVDSRVQ